MFMSATQCVYLACPIAMIQYMIHYSHNSQFRLLLLNVSACLVCPIDVMCDSLFTIHNSDSHFSIFVSVQSVLLM